MMPPDGLFWPPHGEEAWLGARLGAGVRSWRVSSARNVALHLLPDLPGLGLRETRGSGLPSPLEDWNEEKGSRAMDELIVRDGTPDDADWIRIS